MNTLLIFSFVEAVKAFSSPAFAELDCDIVFGSLFSLKIFVTFVQLPQDEDVQVANIGLNMRRAQIWLTLPENERILKNSNSVHCC